MFVFAILVRAESHQQERARKLCSATLMGVSVVRYDTSAIGVLFCSLLRLQQVIYYLCYPL